MKIPSGFICFIFVFVLSHFVRVALSRVGRGREVERRGDREWAVPLKAASREHGVTQRMQPGGAHCTGNFCYLIKSNKLAAICLLKNGTYLFTNIHS